MKALITPGQGKILPEMLSYDFEEKQHWRKVAESFLGKYITADNMAEHDVNSAVIVANAIAIYYQYRSLGGDVGMVAGYSVGQYAALAMAGVLKPESAIEIAVERARIMCRYTRPDMHMLGITGISLEKLRKIMAEITDGFVQTNFRFLSISNFNNMMNFTVSGNIDLLNLLTLRLESAGAKQAELLDTEGAWHSSMLQPAVKEFAELLSRFRFTAPTIIFVDNVSGKAEADPSIIKQNLIAHLTSPVRWEECTHSLIASGAHVFLECGAGKQLAKISFFIDRSKSCMSLNTKEEISECAALQD